MKYRIGAWATAGFLVAAFWALYLLPNAVALNPIILLLARLTCPIAYLHFSVHFDWVLLANAATYALAGLIIERLRFANRATQV